MRYISPLLLAAVMAAPIPHALAQERVAAGGLDVQASWTALKNLADAANNQAKIATVTADSAVKKADVAQTTANTARSEAASAQATANNALTKASRMEACGNRGMIYAPAKANRDSNGCITTTPRLNYAKCEYFRWKKLYGLCPANTVFAGGETRNSDTGEWNGFYCCPFN